MLTYCPLPVSGDPQPLRSSSARQRITLSALLLILSAPVLLAQDHDNKFAILSFDVPNATQTNPTSINSHGVIVGSYSKGTFSGAFMRDPDGKITIIQAPGFDVGFPVSINSAGTITGTINGPGNVTEGFVRDRDGTITRFGVVGSNDTEPASISDDGTIAGTYFFPNSFGNGFVRSPDGAKGEITGNFAAGLGQSPVYGFVRHHNGKIVVYACPRSDATFTQAINDSGVMTGSCLISNPNAHGFIRTRDGEMILFDPHGSTSTNPSAINDRGTITGSYTDSTGVRQHGFVLQLNHGRD